MKWVWVDAGNDADWQKHARHGITGEFYASSDPPVAVRARLEASRARQHAAGLYSAWNWIDGDGEDYATWQHERLREIDPPNLRPSYPKIQLDHEGHDPDDVLLMLRTWRKLRPTQDTSWTMEGFQGGWMDEVFVAEVVQLKIRVVPQCYYGAAGRIEGLFDTLEAARDLTARGFPDHLVTPFYDAAALPRNWSGFAFTMGRLP